MLSSLDGFMSFEEFPQICINIEFVRIRVWALSIEEFLNLATSYLIVLLEARVNSDPLAMVFPDGSEPTDIRGQIALLLFGRH